MSFLIENLLKPLPVEQRVGRQVLRPLYDSRVLAEFFHHKLRIQREIYTSSKKLLAWEPMNGLRSLGIRRIPLSPEMLVTAIPRNDPLRRIPRDACAGSVWMLMAYLCELGPVEAPIVAPAPFVLEKEHYGAYWGDIPGYGQQLYLIRENTMHLVLQQQLNSALLLIEQAVP